MAITSGFGPAITAIAATSFFLLSETHATDLADDRAEAVPTTAVGTSDA